MGEAGDGAGAAESALWPVAAAVGGGLDLAEWWAGEIKEF
jgi:hypothetical protein